MSAPRRFSDGVTNIGKGEALSEMPFPDPTKTYGYFNDFFEYQDGDWVLSNNNDGTTAISDSLAGGVVVLTSDTAENDFDFMQLTKDDGTNDSETFLFATGKKAWFKIRLKFEVVADCESVFGLHIVNTDPRNAAPSDGIYFNTDDGVDEVDLIIAKDSIVTRVGGVHTMVDDTFVSLGYYWDGIDTVHYFVDDVEKGSVYINDNLPDDEYLAVSWGLESGSGAEIMYVDYIGAWMER